MDALLVCATKLDDIVCAIRLGWEGATIRYAGSRTEALRLISARKPELVVIDESFPDFCPMALTRTLRSGIDSVIVITTHEYSDYQLAEAVDAGADDYFSLPINPAVFVPRIRAATRRAFRASEAPISLGSLEVDPSRYQVQVAGREVHLAASEFRVLLELAKLAGRVAPRDLLAAALWGEERAMYAPWLRKYIQSLRRRVCDTPGSDVDIVTIPKVGYKLVLTSGATSEV